jgi:hypothetical protein
MVDVGGMRGGMTVVLALATCSCRSVGPGPAIDPRLAAYVPEDVSAIAGFRPAGFPKLAAAFADQHYVLIALRGSEVLTITDRNLQTPPAAHRPSPLLGEAQRLAEGNPGWLVIGGGTRLPLEGNLANVNRFLRDASLVTLTAQGENPARIELQATCPTTEAASRFENSLRAVLVLTNAGAAAELRRDGQTVRASLTVTPEVLGKLLP